MFGRARLLGARASKLGLDIAQAVLCSLQLPAQLMHAAASVAADERRDAAARAAARRTAESYGIDDMARKLTQLYATLA